MATTRKTRPRLQTDAATICLLANGSAGSWELAIDEATSGADRWWLQIEGPSTAFYFEVPSLEIVARMIQFLERPPATPKESHWLVLSKDEETPITLIKDDEYEDRFFIAAGPLEKPLARFVLVGADSTQISAALRQIQDELGEA